MTTSWFVRTHNGSYFLDKTIKTHFHNSSDADLFLAIKGNDTRGNDVVDNQ